MGELDTGGAPADDIVTDPQTPPDNGGVSDSGMPPANDPPADPPVNEPPADDWRARMSGGDEKLLGYLSRYQSEKAFVEAAKKDREAARQRQENKLPDNPTPEELAGYRKANGIPEAATGYMDTLPDGLVVGDDDKPAVEQFMNAMHEMNAPPAMVNAALDVYYKAQQEQAQAQAEADHEFDNACVDELRNEWGPDFRRNQNILKTYIDGLPQEVADAIKGGRDGNGVPLSMSAPFLRWLTAEAMERNPVSVVVPGAGANQASAITSEIAEIEKLMSDRGSDYWKGPKSGGLQARYIQLIEAQQKLQN